MSNLAGFLKQLVEGDSCDPVFRYCPECGGPTESVEGMIDEGPEAEQAQARGHDTAWWHRVCCYNCGWSLTVDWADYEEFKNG